MISGVSLRSTDYYGLHARVQNCEQNSPQTIFPVRGCGPTRLSQYQDHNLHGGVATLAENLNNFG